MSRNRIIALAFDRETFPLSPHYEEYMAMETDDELIFVGGEKADEIDDFICVFDADETAHVPALPEGEYVIKATRLNDDKRFKIEFAFINQKDSSVPMRCILDAKHYLQTYLHAFTAAVGSGGTIEATPYEEQFSINYLRNSFAPTIEGNDDFWLRFYSDLDVATAPLNLLISRDAAGKPDKPVVVKNSDKLKPVFN
jgi:hypothetical protein